ncbi:hypothetical protein [Cupriavidus basilensis]|uniref:hypothetical protein n=1 Tax=Cupriavidus basilensis TaxID=68895 RepID=UPI0023E8498A|nr:hypothetical protein [Cupriavidus basilensis]MDF3883020.1 hypothetical protein [Cupriavidus basilensis]
MPAERVAPGLLPCPFLGTGHGGILRPRLHRYQLNAHFRHRLLALLPQTTLLIDLAQRAALGSTGPFLRDSHLFAGALKVRRELNTLLNQLPLERLDLPLALVVTHPRGRWG